MLKRLLTTLAVLALLAQPAGAQITTPNTLVAGSVIRAADLNTNFSTLGNHALDRLSGGNISGNITADSGITIDGIDIGASLCPSCAATFASVTVNGVGIINASGKIPALTSTYFTTLAFDSANLTGTAAAINGSAITALNASNLASGTVATARLGSGSASSTTFLRGDQAYASLCPETAVATSSTHSAALCTMIEANGTFTVTLPAASTATNPGRNIIDIKNIGTGTITVARAGSDTIDGATSYSLSVQYQSITLIANTAGNGWLIK